MKNEYSYGTREEAMDALNDCLILDFRWGSEHEVDFWLREFIRGSDDDMDWMISAIYSIGIEYEIIWKWFFIQDKYPEIWTNESHNLISALAGIFEKLQLKNV
jgi:hypothetical protein